jgi:hypothetical protein
MVDEVNRPTLPENAFGEIFLAHILPPNYSHTEHFFSCCITISTSNVMSLVQYSDSEPDSDHNQQVSTPRPAKRIRRTPPTDTRPAPSLPPLPATFHDLYASSTRVSVRDDPSLHGGRKRVIPHVEGNWPTHIYLECKCCYVGSFLQLTRPGYPTKEDLAILDDVISQIESKVSEMNIHSLLYSDLAAPLPLHISLSRPVVLRTEQRHSFVETLERGIRNSHVQS